MALPLRTGCSFKPCHLEDILTSSHTVAWFEVHPENYMTDGGAPHHALTHLRTHYPVSFHGVGLSLGTAQPLSTTHLQRLCALIRRYEPEVVSEHLSWSFSGGTFLNDLLPLPYTKESLSLMVDHVAHTQEVLGRPLLLENPSHYMGFEGNDFHEAEFLSQLVATTGCRILLDVNNLFVSTHNMGGDPYAYIDHLPHQAIEEIHIAGHSELSLSSGSLLIDDHGSHARQEVLDLLFYTLQRVKAPVLLEWDTNLPPFSTFAEDVEHLNSLGERAHGAC